ncbi:MAG: radical SAM protein [Planctomycetota bacterium]
MFDRFNRRINYLRISVTDRCNLHCRYCRDGEGDAFGPMGHADLLRYEEIRAIVTEAAALGITKVRLTGGEPLIKRDIEVLVGFLAGIAGIAEVTMTTNGTLLAAKARVLKDAGLARINISLDSLDPQRYRDLTGGGDIAAVLAGITAAGAAGFRNTKINMVIIDGFNTDETERMRAFCRGNGLTLQLIRQFSLKTPKDPEALAGFDRPPPCGECNKIRLLANGMLKPCLHTDAEIPIRMDDIRSSLLEAVDRKPHCGDACMHRVMNQIGG